MERINYCNSCKNRALCEYFVPSELCFIDERFNFEIYGREGNFRKQWELYINQMMRTFGNNSEARKNKAWKNADGYFQEINQLNKRSDKNAPRLQTIESLAEKP